MPKKQGEFNAIIEGNHRRYVSRNFPVGSTPVITLGTAQGCVLVQAWEQGTDVMIRVSIGRWGLGDGEPINGVNHVLYEGPILLR